MIRLLSQADRQIILKYLKRNEIETSFLYANIIEFGVENKPEIRRCADYYGYFDGEDLKGILSFYNLGSCIPHYEAGEVVPLFADLMKKRGFHYLLGMRKIIKPLYDKIKASKEIKEYDESSYFVNKNYRPFNLAGIRFLDAAELNDTVLDFIINARKNGFNQITAKEDIIKMLIQRGAEEDFILAQKDGKLVAQACIQTYTPAINQIGGVYTTADERGKGYCKAVVSEICRRIVDRGKMPALSVKKENMPAVRAYNALGFEHYDDYLIVRLSQRT